MQRIKSNGILIAMTLVVGIIQGCSSTKMSVQPPSRLAVDQHGALCGNLVYDGSNTSYLPKIISQAPNSSQQSAQFKYDYEVLYNVDHDTVFDLYNPFLILGVPKSKDNILVSGQLEFSGTDNFSKTYRHTINLTKRDSIFSDGDTLSEVRRKGLYALRDSLDEMVLADLSLLKSQGFSCNTFKKT